MSVNLPIPAPDALVHSAKLCELIRQDISTQGGWIPFSRFMELALYAPGLGYYTAGAHKFGESGDFITAPELSTLFGRTMARQLVEVMQASTPHILELGAGSGKLALDILGELEKLGALPENYSILEVSADLRQRQQALISAKLPHLASLVHWLDALPENISGAVIGNEVLDALPVHLLHWTKGKVQELGVTNKDHHFVWQDKPLKTPALHDIVEKLRVPNDYISEVSLTARGLVASLCERMSKGALLFIDYGFGAREYYHPQRSRGTLMCHYRHHSHDDPFYLPGLAGHHRACGFHRHGGSRHRQRRALSRLHLASEFPAQQRRSGISRRSLSGRCQSLCARSPPNCKNSPAQQRWANCSR